MANSKPNAAAAAPATAAAVPASPVMLVSIPATFKLPKATSARGAWLAALQAHHGKTVAQFTAHVTAQPPSTPAKGKLAGKLEPVSGWLGYFARNGVLRYQQPGK